MDGVVRVVRAILVRFLTELSQQLVGNVNKIEAAGSYLNRLWWRSCFIKVDPSEVKVPPSHVAPASVKTPLL